MDFNEDDIDLAELEEKQKRASILKGVLSGAGGMLQAQANVPSAYEYLYGKVGQPTDFQGTFDKMSGAIKDPMENKKKAMEYLKTKRGIARDEADAEFTDYSRNRERTLNTKADEKSARLGDVTSGDSLGARAFYKKQGLDVSDADTHASLTEKYGPAADWAKMSAKQKAEARERAAQHKNKLTEIATEQGYKRGHDVLTHEQEKELLALKQAHARDMLDEEGKQKLAALEAKKTSGRVGKQLPADKVLAVNDGNSIPTMLKDIGASIENNPNAFGPIIGRMRKHNPYDETAQAVQAQVKAASQAFGRYMEGGVLRKEDEVKYEKMFPQPSDTPATAKNKLAIVNKLLVDKQGSNLQALRKSGWDTSGLEGTSLGEGKTPQVLEAGVAADDKVEVFAPDGTLKRIKKSDVNRALAAGGRLKDGPAVGAK